MSEITPEKRRAIDRTVKTLKIAGLWGKIDVLFYDGRNIYFDYPSGNQSPLNTSPHHPLAD